MEEAHVDAVTTLGQVFNVENEYYDFGAQDVTKKYVTRTKNAKTILQQNFELANSSFNVSEYKSWYLQ